MKIMATFTSKYINQLPCMHTQLLTLGKTTFKASECQ